MRYAASEFNGKIELVHALLVEGSGTNGRDRYVAMFNNNGSILQHKIVHFPLGGNSRIERIILDITHTPTLSPLVVNNPQSRDPTKRNKEGKELPFSKFEGDRTDKETLVG